jgi:pimeloyl-ACP methyl ester carboxylesterase
MPQTNVFQGPMQPWRSLTPLGRKINLPENNLDLFVFEAGQTHKQVVLMIHGLGDEADTWRHVIEPLATDFHIIALDLPGFGRSNKPDLDYTPDFYIDSVLGLMNQMEIENAILMGSSLGSMISQGLAILHPNRVKGLILVAGSLFQPSPMKENSLRLMQVPLLGEWLYTRLRKDPQAAFDSLRNVYYDLDSLPEVDREFLFQRVNHRVWNNGQRRAFFSTLRNLATWVKANQRDLPEQLAELAMPTLVVRGDHDKLFLQENAQGTIENQPDATYVEISGVGHHPQQEDPKTFTRIVRKWLKTNLLPG